MRNAFSAPQSAPQLPRVPPLDSCSGKPPTVVLPLPQSTSLYLVLPPSSSFLLPPRLARPRPQRRHTPGQVATSMLGQQQRSGRGAT